MICIKANVRPGFYGAPHSGARVSAYKQIDPAGQFLDAGQIHSARADKNALGAPARLDVRGEAGAHIAELIKTMLEKRASGIDLH